MQTHIPSSIGIASDWPQTRNSKDKI